MAKTVAIDDRAIHLTADSGERVGGPTDMVVADPYPKPVLDLPHVISDHEGIYTIRLGEVK